MIEEIDIKKFIVSYLYSLSSLIISMILFGMIMSPEHFDWQNILGITVMLIIYGAPIVLVGCIVGELLYRYIIIPKSISFKLAFVIYFLLGSIVMLLMTIFLSGIPQNANEFFDLQFMIFPTICSVVFFIKRNTYK